MVNKKMGIVDVMNLDPETAAIMSKYGMHCFGCPFSMMESLEDACAGHGTDVDELVRELNDFLSKKAAAAK